MRNRTSQQTKYHTGKEVVLAERAKQGDCTFCPPNQNENENGRHSLWGRKVAAKQKYRTGKGRKEINWWQRGPWNLTDFHYKPGEIEQRKKLKMYKETQRGEIKLGLEEIGRQIHNRSPYYTSQFWKTLKDNENHEASMSWSGANCDYILTIRKQKEPRNQ